MEHTVEELAKKMDALDLWSAIAPFNWAVKPKGTVFPYFCTTLPGDGKLVKIRFLMLEGWQTLHEFVHVRADPNFGFYSSPIEFPHLELVILANGESKLFRHDTGYMPIEADARQRELAVRILWEAFGVMLRLESDRTLPLRFAGEKAIFARVETADGKYEDTPLEIPNPPPHVEQISFEKADLKAAQDLPFVAEDVLHVDFVLLPNTMTRELPRPRCVYRLLAHDPIRKETAFDLRVSVTREGGLRGMWEAVPAQFLKQLVQRGKVPGEVKVVSGRLFRMMRPLCVQLPFKLSLHDKL